MSYNYKDLADLTGYDLRTLYSYVTKGRIPDPDFYDNEGRAHWNNETIDEWMEEWEGRSYEGVTPEDDIVDVNDLQKKLNYTISNRTILRWVESGKLPPFDGKVDHRNVWLRTTIKSEFDRDHRYIGASPEVDSLITVIDIADMVGRTVSTIYQWRSTGKLPDPDGKKGRKYVWYRTTIENWLDERAEA